SCPPRRSADLLRPRFAYGRLLPWIQVDGHTATLTSGPDALAFAGPVRHLPDPATARLEADFAVRAGERLPFTLAHYPSHEPAPGPIDAEAELERTERRWRAWADRCTYRGPYREAVVRSLLTLKALTHERTGGIVAAPTTSIPEEFGGVRNWD